MAPQLTLQLLRPEDAVDILAFEWKNRDFFAQIIGDRGDKFFADYPKVHAGLLAEIERGDSLLYLVRDAQGGLVGRVNFTKLKSGPASLGYRFTKSVGGQGYATAAVAQALQKGRVMGIQQVRATVALENPASRRVLEKLGFLRLPNAEQDMEWVERNGRKIAVEQFVLDLSGAGR